jgi:hypothetical protein
MQSLMLQLAPDWFLTEESSATRILYTQVLSLVGLSIFFLSVVATASSHAKSLFFSLQGWSHRLAGAALLTWLIFGVIQIIVLIQSTEKDNDTFSASASTKNNSQFWWLYDTVLGLLGVTTTLTAARDFPHKYVQNAKGQSGSLSTKALVTQAEMIEHSFYQALNLLQAWFLHFVSSQQQQYASSTATDEDGTAVNTFNYFVWPTWVALGLVTSPWFVRHYFPVHSFSDNWNVTPAHQRTTQEVILYRIKKGQYLFYKHVLLHGLNISVALRYQQSTLQPTHPSSLLSSVLTRPSWRLYWLALNTSYVMEFFLQTMVRFLGNNLYNITLMICLHTLYV